MMLVQIHVVMQFVESANTEVRDSRIEQQNSLIDYREYISNNTSI